MPPLEPDTIVVVSGLPRSGTSMMMQMLAAGGIEVLTDGVRAPDASNPHGYFELEAVKRLGRDDAWLAEASGRAVKVVAPLVPRLPLARRYRVVMMERRLDDVLRSQRAMLRRLHGSEAECGPSDAQLATAFARDLDHVHDHLSRHDRRFEVLRVSYEETLADPLAVAELLDDFLGGCLDLGAVAGAVRR